MMNHGETPALQFIKLGARKGVAVCRSGEAADARACLVFLLEHSLPVLEGCSPRSNVNQALEQGHHLRSGEPPEDT